MASSPHATNLGDQSPIGPFREPVVPSLTPVALRWEAASSNLLTILVDAFGRQGDFLTASGTSTTQVSYCRLKRAERGSDLFIKIIPKGYASGLQRSDGISKFINGCGLLTPVCLPGFPKTSIDGRVIVAYPFVEGVYLSSSRNKLHALASALGKLHTALAYFPDVHRIACRQREMRTGMRAKAKDLLLDQQWASGDLSPVRAYLQRWLEIDATLETDGCQVIHNDLNAGNLLQDAKGRVWFLDFEEASWSYLPPVFDVAKVIERFILVKEDWDKQTKVTASQQFLCNYRDAFDGVHGTGGGIPTALRWQLGFSWLRMSGLLFEQGAIGHPEVRKFLHLAQLLDENEVWLSEL